MEQEAAAAKIEQDFERVEMGLSPLSSPTNANSGSAQASASVSATTSQSKLTAPRAAGLKSPAPASEDTTGLGTFSAVALKSSYLMFVVVLNLYALSCTLLPHMLSTPRQRCFLLSHGICHRGGIACQDRVAHIHAFISRQQRLDQAEDAWSARPDRRW